MQHQHITVAPPAPAPVDASGVLAWLQGDDSALDERRRVAEADADGAQRSEHRPSGNGDAVAPYYLEPKGKCCGQPETKVTRRLEAKPHRCTSRFCPDCCLPLGLKLKAKLLPILETFKGLQMWTLTIDPTLFADPESAFAHVQKRRAIGELIRALDKMGVLHSRRYFCVVEWQKETKMPHYHILLDASFIPFALVCSIWNRNRPNHLPPPELNPATGKARPGFGSVRFTETKHKFATATHAANYACKYLIKHPQEGYPDWVLNSSRKIQRCWPSKGFWGSSQPKGDQRSAAEVEFHDMHDAKACEECKQGRCCCKPPEPSKRKRRTIRERLNDCGQGTLIMEVTEFVTPDGEATTLWRYVDQIPMPFDDVLHRLGLEAGQRRIELSYESLAKLRSGSNSSGKESHAE